MRIVQMSDIHVGPGLFEPELMDAAVEETNAFEPDLVAIPGTSQWRDTERNSRKQSPT